MKLKIFSSLILSSFYFHSFAVDYQQVSTQILIPKCLACHNQEFGFRDIDLSSYESTLQTIIPWDPENSLLYQTINHESQSPMPPNEPLSRAEIRMIKTWILRGAPEADL